MAGDMHLVDEPTFFPSTCGVCGNAHGAMADTRVENRLGRLYVCERCVRDMARLFGMVEASEIAEVRLIVGDLEAKVAEQEGELAELLPIRGAIDRAAERYAGLVEAV